MLQSQADHSQGSGSTGSELSGNSHCQRGPVITLCQICHRVKQLQALPLFSLCSPVQSTYWNWAFRGEIMLYSVKITWTNCRELVLACLCRAALRCWEHLLMPLGCTQLWRRCSGCKHLDASQNTGVPPVACVLLDIPSLDVCWHI